MNNFPVIGDPVIDPNDKHLENGIAKYDLLLADGSIVDPVLHPDYYATLPKSSSEINAGYCKFHYLPVASASGQIVYMIDANMIPQRSDDGGVTFSALPDAGLVYSVFEWGMCCSADGETLIVYDSNGCWRITDGGTTVAPLGKCPVNVDSQIACSDDASVVYVTNFVNGRCYVNTNGSGWFQLEATGLVEGGRTIACSDDGSTWWTAANFNGGYDYISEFVRTGQTTCSLVRRHEITSRVGSAPKALARVWGSTDLIFSTEDGDIYTTDVDFLNITIKGSTARNPAHLGNGDGSSFWFEAQNSGYLLTEASLRPIMDSGDPLSPYKIVADLTGV